MVDGLLNINKYQGITSFDVVARLRRILGVRRIGHCGTLDPLAWGLVLVCLGRATKLVQFLTNHDKEYIADIALGKSTETFDRYGAVTSEADFSGISEADVQRALEPYIGEIDQAIPRHSAVKHDGRPLYEYARKGIETPQKHRRVRISTIELLKYNPPHIKIRVVCSKGTYIRSLADDVGSALGCGAHLFALCRTRIGEFTLDESQTLGQIEARKKLGKLDEKLIGLSSALHLPSLTVGDQYVEKIRSGSDVTGSWITSISENFGVGEKLSLVDQSGSLLAIGESLVGSTGIHMKDIHSSPVIKYIRVM